MKKKTGAARCERLLARLSDYIDGALPPSFCERLERHLEGCPPCVEFIKTLEKTVGTLKAVGRTARPPHSARRDLAQALRACAKTLPKRL